MELPTKPSSEDCCNSGCSTCIFDVYERQLKLYRDHKESPVTVNENGISDLKYTNFIIGGTILLSDSLKIITFKRDTQDATSVWWKPGDHFLYRYKIGSFSCTRAYSPFKLKSDMKNFFDFSIVLKRYTKGLVSNHLFELKEGDVTLWRGPYGSYKVQSNTFNRIIMVAQGTGIAPFITIIESILNNEDDMTKIILFYCCQSVNEILFRDELNLYKSYWNFSYTIFITSVSSNDDIRYREPIIYRRFSPEDLYTVKPYYNDQFLICGSPTFMECYFDLLKNQDIPSENIILF